LVRKTDRVGIKNGGDGRYFGLRKLAEQPNRFVQMTDPVPEVTAEPQ
jgi:hypothetical protein